jgi:hypothetical protein
MDVRTTVIFRNIPNNYSAEMLLDLLDANGFKNHYDFVYVPHDFKRLPQRVNIGYFFINFVVHEKAAKAMEKFQGFNNWSVNSAKVINCSWAAETQGLTANIRRYKNCPVMHADVPEDCKPMIFRHGAMETMVTTKKIRQPRMRKGSDKPSEELTGGACDAIANTVDLDIACPTDVDGMGAPFRCQQRTSRVQCY